MVTFKISDMTCGGCAMSVQRALKAADVNAEVVVNVRDRLISVTRSELTVSSLETAIRRAGFTPQRSV